MDITAYNLSDYRTQLNVVLQNTAIFEGSILSNIKQNYINDQEFSKIKQDLVDFEFDSTKLDRGKLGYLIESEGANLSESEKQIIGLVRCLNKPSKVVVMDEATASLDRRLVQKFREKFFEGFGGEATVLLIAHDLRNVMGMDRVLVFDEGRVVQDGPPVELIRDRSGLFYQLWSGR